MEKLRVFTAFSGYDSQCLGLERLKENFPEFDYELVGWSEIDKNAIKAHNALFPQWADRNYGDISKIDWSKVPDFDLFTYSSPCFVAGTMVLTSDGYKPIEEVKIGDYVLTHTNTFQKVTNTMCHRNNGIIVKLTGMSIEDTFTTEEHPYYVRRMYRKGHKSERCFHEPEWIKAKNLDTNCYFGYAINQNSKIPVWGGSIDNRWGHGKKVNNLEKLLDKSDFWYLMGRYVGDGWKKNSESGSSIIISCSDRNRESLTNSIEKCGLHYNIYEKEKSANKVVITMNELASFVDRYGYYANGKHIDSETLDLPVDLLKAFLDGYVASDGCLIKDINTYKITTVSRELSFGIVQCVAKAYHRPAAIYKTIRPQTKVIEGRTVNQRDSYSVVWKLDNRKQDKAFYEDGYIWFPMNKLPKFINQETDVYNLTVENDNSYTANGAIVHNCTDFSTAGLQQGGTEGSGTRSSLLWECRRCIEEKRPKYTLFENVQALLQKKFKDVFNKWISTVNNYGYQSSYQILNSSDFGVPQNRTRIFMVSVRNDVNMVYKFPGPLNKCPHLYEILEPDCDVDSKYTRKPSRLKHYLELNAEDMAYLDSPANSNDKYEVIPCGVYCHCTDPFNAPPLFDCSRTLKAESIESGIIYKQNGKWHMRLFTPHECFRLMGLTDEEYEKINQVVPQTGQSKCAGNSIVVNVLYHIFRRMFIDIDVPDRGTQNVLF